MGPSAPVVVGLENGEDTETLAMFDRASSSVQEENSASTATEQVAQDGRPTQQWAESPPSSGNGTDNGIAKIKNDYETNRPDQTQSA